MLIAATFFLVVAGVLILTAVWSIAVYLVVDAYQDRSAVPIFAAAGLVACALALTGIGLLMVTFRWPALLTGQ